MILYLSASSSSSLLLGSESVFDGDDAGRRDRIVLARDECAWISASVFLEIWDWRKGRNMPWVLLFFGRVSWMNG